MNPYDFVRLDWSKPPHRRPFTSHDHFVSWSGRVDGCITAETPLFIQESTSVITHPGPRRFQANANGTPIIPGSSLKGLLRSLVETVGPGCWWLFDGMYSDNVDYRANLPAQFQRCSRLEALCPACRLFGLVHRGGAAMLGKVCFDDATCIQKVQHDPIFTPILDVPKPRHRAWYLDDTRRWVAGRKFYFHQSAIRTEPRLEPSSRIGQPRNQHIVPLGSGSVFAFTGHFTNLTDDELALLLYTLVLEQAGLGHAHDLRHKLGYGKPAGLGSVRVELTRLVRWQGASRYIGRTTEHYEGDALRDLLKHLIDPYATNRTSITLQDLRRIWQWPANGNYRYPDRTWFTKYPEAPIGKTP